MADSRPKRRVAAAAGNRRRSMVPGTHRVTGAFRDFVVDQLAGLDVTPRAMFGGVGLYAGEAFFGLLSRDVLYLKVDATTRPRYVAAGSTPFHPYPDRLQTMTFGYYAVPLTVLESAPELVMWAREAVDVAERASASRAQRSKRRGPHPRRPHRGKRHG